MHKYMTVPNKIHYDLCESMTHATNQCRALGTLAERLDWTMFRVNETPQDLEDAREVELEVGLEEG